MLLTGPSGIRLRLLAKLDRGASHHDDEPIATSQLIADFASSACAAEEERRSGDLRATGPGDSVDTTALIVTNLRAEPHRLARDTDPELVNPLGLLRFD
jgi:hypothetical protein